MCEQHARAFSIQRSIFFHFEIENRHGRVRPCAIVEVVSKKLSSKIRRLCGEFLEIRENENLMRKILKGNGEWGECTRERVNV